MQILLQNGLKIVKKISRGCAPDPLTPGQVRGVPEGCRRAVVWLCDRCDVLRTKRCACCNGPRMCGYPLKNKHVFSLERGKVCSVRCSLLGLELLAPGLLSAGRVTVVFTSRVGARLS